MCARIKIKFYFIIDLNKSVVPNMYRKVKTLIIFKIIEYAIYILIL